MASPTLHFFARELSNSMRRNTLMLFASIGTAAMLVFLLGLFWLLLVNTRKMEATLAAQMEIHAYLKANVADQETHLLLRKIASVPAVASVVYTSKEEALSELKKNVEQKIDLSGIVQNPLPAYLVVKVRKLGEISAVSNLLRQEPEVEEVHDLQGTVNRFAAFFEMTDHLFLGLVILLLFCNLFIIYNMTRLGVFSRKKEIEIMQLVGAGPTLIRWPFILEGTFYGLLGALVAILLLNPGYHALAGKLAEIFPAFPLLGEKTIWSLFFWLLGIGTIVGCSGSFLSVNRYLRS